LTQNPVQETVPNHVPVSTPPTNRSLLIILFSFFILILLASTGFLYYQNQQLKKQLAGYQTQPTPSPTFDPTADWKTYTNHTHNISFRYSPSWNLTENVGQVEDNKTYNTKVGLSKGNALITMYLNLNGIGGIPQTYEGKSFILDGHNLYQFNKVNSYNNTKEVGVSDSLTTLGVFKINDITYSIIIAYLADYEKSNEENLLREFDQILSTFKFMDQSGAEGKFCGGIAANLPENQCPEGYQCKLDGNYPDASGVCTKN